jgi:hypothetical protein
MDSSLGKYVDFDCAASNCQRLPLFDAKGQLLSRFVPHDFLDPARSQVASPITALVPRLLNVHIRKAGPVADSIQRRLDNPGGEPDLGFRSLWRTSGAPADLF